MSEISRFRAFLTMSFLPFWYFSPTNSTTVPDPIDSTRLCAYERMRSFQRVRNLYPAKVMHVPNKKPPCLLQAKNKRRDRERERERERESAREREQKIKIKIK
jgi:hypothetical protein